MLLEDEMANDGLDVIQRSLRAQLQIVLNNLPDNEKPANSDFSTRRLTYVFKEFSIKPIENPNNVFEVDVDAFGSLLSSLGLIDSSIQNRIMDCIEKATENSSTKFQFTHIVSFGPRPTPTPIEEPVIARPAAVAEPTNSIRKEADLLLAGFGVILIVATVFLFWRARNLPFAWMLMLLFLIAAGLAFFARSRTTKTPAAAVAAVAFVLLLLLPGLPPQWFAAFNRPSIGSGKDVLLPLKSRSTVGISRLPEGLTGRQFSSEPETLVSQPTVVPVPAAPAGPVITVAEKERLEAEIRKLQEKVKTLSKSKAVVVQQQIAPPVKVKKAAVVSKPPRRVHKLEYFYMWVPRENHHSIPVQPNK